jgi:DNA-binding response OmpR family regulator
MTRQNVRRTHSAQGARYTQPEAPEARRVLVVEDDTSVRELVAQVLESDGYVADTAPSGPDALAIIGSNDRRSPDLILLDLRLPGMDAHTFVRRYRDLAPAPAPIVVFTALSAVEAADAAERTGATGFVVKPFDVDTLLTMVDRHTRRSEQPEQAMPEAPQTSTSAREQAQAARTRGATEAREQDQAAERSLVPVSPAPRPVRATAGADPKDSSAEERRRQRLLLLARHVTTVRERLAAAHEQIRHWHQVEQERSLDHTERRTVQRLRLESEGMRLEMEQLRASFEELRSQR